MLCGMMTLKKCLRPKTCLILDIKIGYKGVCNDVELLLSEIPEWQIPTKLG